MPRSYGSPPLRTLMAYCPDLSVKQCCLLSDRAAVRAFDIRPGRDDRELRDRGDNLILFVPARGALQNVLSRIQNLRETYPDARCLLVCDRCSAARSPNADALARLGYRVMSCGNVSQLVFEEWTRYADAAVSELLRSVFSDCAPLDLHGTIRRMIELSADNVSMSGVARILGVPQRTLEARFRSARLPTPVRCLSWCRVVRAAWLLDRTGSSMKVVSRRLGYSTPLALSASIRRMTGTSWNGFPGLLRFESVVSSLCAELSTAPVLVTENT